MSDQPFITIQNKGGDAMTIVIVGRSSAEIAELQNIILIEAQKIGRPYVKNTEE